MNNVSWSVRLWSVHSGSHIVLSFVCIHGETKHSPSTCLDSAVFTSSCWSTDFTPHLQFALILFPLHVSSLSICRSSPLLLPQLCSLVLATAAVFPHQAPAGGVLSERVDLWHASRGCVNKIESRGACFLLSLLEDDRRIFDKKNKTETWQLLYFLLWGAGHIWQDSDLWESCY